jgi:hypothetical protein
MYESNGRKRGKKLRKAMIEREMTQADVCRDFNRAPGSVSKFIAGNSKSRPLANYFINKGFSEELFNDGMVAE